MSAMQQEYFKQTGRRAICVGYEDHNEYEWQYVHWLEERAALGAQPATIAALRELYDACILADANGDLSEHIDGSILDRAKTVLQWSVENKYIAAQNNVEAGQNGHTTAAAQNGGDSGSCMSRYGEGD